VSPARDVPKGDGWLDAAAVSARQLPELHGGLSAMPAEQVAIDRSFEFFDGRSAGDRVDGESLEAVLPCKDIPCRFRHSPRQNASCSIDRPMSDRLDLGMEPIQGVDDLLSLLRRVFAKDKDLSNERVGSSRSARSAVPSSSTRMAYMIPATSTTGCCWASRGR